MKHEFDDLNYEVSARRSMGVWGLLVFGLLFAYAGLMVNPASNCGENGECAPWLVYVARIIGLLLTFGAVRALVKNQSCGSRIDPDTGELVWWYSGMPPTGSIHPSNIGLIRIENRDEGSDKLSLYDTNGKRQSTFSEMVVAKPIEDWAHKLSEKWPHIEVRVEHK